jgi:hypothetical protein
MRVRKELKRIKSIRDEGSFGSKAKKSGKINK